MKFGAEMIQCEKSKVSLIEEDVLFIELEQDMEFSLKDYKEIRLASLKLASNKEVFNLIHVGDKTIPDREAREACTRDVGNGLIKAEAIIIHSLGQRIVASHMLKEKGKQIPVKIFSNVETAKAWLDSIRES